MDNLPFVSIIIPTFNNGSLLHRAVNSALKQDYPNKEIIIVDDCSCDNTSQFVNKSYQNDGRVIYYRMERNSGPAVARNVALSMAHGDLIAFLDADDEWLPGKLSTQVLLMQEHPQIDVLFTNVIIIDEKNNKSKNYAETNKIFSRHLLLTPLANHSELFRVHGEVKRQLYRGNFICISSVMIKKEKILSVNGFDNTCFGTEDLDLWVRLAEICSYYYFHKVTVQYYWTPSSISWMGEKRLRELLRYHKAALTSPDYSDLKDIALWNLHYYYKLLILVHNRTWNVIGSWSAYFESRQFELAPGLWIYSLAGLFGPIPVWIKNRLINPVKRFIKNNIIKKNYGFDQ